MADLPRAFGQYVLLKALGASGTSDVYLARPQNPNAGLPTPLVIKRLHGELAAQDEFYSRFMHEAQIAISAECPHLPVVYDVGRVGDAVYIAMEYLTGWTVARLISDLQAAGKQASISSCVDVISGALTALAALHGAVDKETRMPLGIVHRDIAPKNVMVGEDGVTRLIDFGLGKSRLEEWKTETGVVLGTPGYMAPEQVRAQPLDQRADVYAMGIVAWELLTLRPYVRRGPVPLMLRAQASPTFTPPSSIRPDVPAQLDEVLRRALAANPAERFQSALQFFDALRTAVPQDDTLDPLPTLVGEMLWGELNQEKSEVTQLVAKSGDAGPSSNPRVLETTADDRPRSGIRGAPQPLVQPQPIGPAYALEPTAISGTMASDPHLHAPTPTPIGSMVMPVHSNPAHLAGPRGIRLELVLAMLAATLVLGVVMGLLLRDGGTTQAITTVPITAVEEPAAAPLPAVAPAATVQVVPPAPPPEPQPKERTRPARTASARTAVKNAPLVEDAPPPAKEQNPRERVNTLIKRAKTIKAGLAAGSPDEARATSLINRLAMEASSNEANSAKLSELESELSKLENGAR